MIKKLGFTLAETLMTLAIIGVIFTLTIPTLNSAMRKRENILALEKAWATISNVTGELEQEYGPIRFWRMTTGTLMDEMYIPRLNVIRNCRNGGRCFADGYKTRSLNGGDNNQFETDTGWYTFVTADGLYWAIGGLSEDCSYKEGTYIKNGCMHFEVDVNGPKKPNTMGIDIFGFTLTRNGIFPFGGCPGCDTSSCDKTSGNGWGCSAKLLREKKYTW